jgi:DNA-binding NtrC family response regulator
MAMKCDILVVDDDPNISQVVESILSLTYAVNTGRNRVC